MNRSVVERHVQRRVVHTESPKEGLIENLQPRRKPHAQRRGVHIEKRINLEMEPSIRQPPSRQESTRPENLHREPEGRIDREPPTKKESTRPERTDLLDRMRTQIHPIKYGREQIRLQILVMSVLHKLYLLENHNIGTHTTVDSIPVHVNEPRQVPRQIRWGTGDLAWVHCLSHLIM